MVGAGSPRPFPGANGAIAYDADVFKKGLGEAQFFLGGVDLSAKPDGQDYIGGFSPDGQQIAYVDQPYIPGTDHLASVTNIFTMDAGGGLQAAAHPQLWLGSVRLRSGVLADGQRIAFIRESGLDPQTGTYSDTALYTMRTDGSDLKLVLDDWPPIYEPEYSPDGPRSRSWQRPAQRTQSLRSGAFIPTGAL